MADLREREESCGAGRGHEGARGCGIAHLVGLALKHHPGHREAGEGGEVVADALDLLLEGEAALPARRVVDLEVRTEAEADRPGERLRGCGGQGRVDERRARRVAHQDRALVRRELAVELDRAGQLLQGARRVGAALRRLQALQERTDVDADDERAEVPHALRHRDDTQVPAAVARDEQHDLVGRALRRVERDLAERGQGECLGGLAGEGRGGERERQRREPVPRGTCLISGRSSGSHPR